MFYACVCAWLHIHSYIHHSKQYIHDSILQSDNHVMQTTSSHSHPHTHSAWEAVGGDGLKWLTVKNTLQIMQAKNSFQNKMEYGMVSKWVRQRVRVRAFSLTGITYCLSATKWMLFHIYTFFSIPAFLAFALVSSRIKPRPCTAFVHCYGNIDNIHTIIHTYLNVMHGIFLMNYCTWFHKYQAVSQ